MPNALPGDKTRGPRPGLFVPYADGLLRFFSSGRSGRAHARDSILHAALTLAHDGFYVFPLRPGSKLPLKGSRGLYDATRDQSQIIDWFETDDVPNIGISPGRSGVIVVDLAYKDGVEAWPERLPISSLTPTLTAQTPSGGFHRYYRLPPHVMIGSSIDRVGKGVTIRSTAGYIVAPPSIVAGEKYHWTNELPMASAPEWTMGVGPGR